MLPITELRAAIPWAILIQNIPWYHAVLFAVFGNFLITIPILFLIEPVSNLLRRWNVWDRFFNWLFARTRKKGRIIEKIEFWGLVVFVGIPLPVTGAWTGCVAAYIFGLSKKVSFIAIFIGLCISACIVTILTMTGYFVVN